MDKGNKPEPNVGDNVKSPIAKKSKASTSTSEVSQDTPTVKIEALLEENLSQENVDINDENRASTSHGSLQTPSSISQQRPKSPQTGDLLKERNHLSDLTKEFNFTDEEWEKINECFMSLKKGNFLTENISVDVCLNAVKEAGYYLDLKVMKEVNEFLEKLPNQDDSSPDSEDGTSAKDAAAQKPKCKTMNYRNFCTTIAHYREWCIAKVKSGIKEKSQDSQDEKLVSSDGWQQVLMAVFQQCTRDRFMLYLKSLALDKQHQEIKDDKVLYKYEIILEKAYSYQKPAQGPSSSSS